MARNEPILIAGGGIAGLATALALALHGIPSRILEAREQVSEAGAGIQIGPNGVRVLAALGVTRHLQPHASLPVEIVVRQGASARILAHMPLGAWIEARHGAPYWVVHRRDLQAALLACVRAEPAIDFTTGFAVSDIATADTRIDVRDPSGNTATGGILVGADGIRSRVRETVSPGLKLNFSGKAASRTLLPAGIPGPLGDATRMGVWLAPGAHVVHYPVQAGAQIAVVAIVPDDRRIDDWAAPNDWQTLSPHLTGFAPELREALGTAPEWRRWALFETAPLQRLAAGRIALIGDAAHPVLPFLAQGGVMALEDAMVLADAVSRQRDNPQAALQSYESARRARVNAIVSTSRQNGTIFHLSGPAALARNLVLAAVPATRLMARYDWVYGWQPPA
jgi:salicylate hydroxylase